MLNHIVIMGRLCDNPETRYTQSQKEVTTFRMAVERDFDREHKADFIGCAAWGKTSEFIAKYFTKGSMAIVSGRLQIREWTDRNGNKRNEPEIIADHVYFGESKAKEDKPTAFAELDDKGELPF